MFNKKIFMSVLIIGIICALAGSATWAYFQDTEYSNDNTLTAGTLDLDLDGNPLEAGTFYLADGIKPGDSNSSYYQTITNVGSLDGELDIEVNNLQNDESSGVTEFEGDGTGGELGGFVMMALWLDLNHDDQFDDGSDISLKSDGSTAKNNNSGNFYYSSINSYFFGGSRKWNALETSMDPGDVYHLHILWDFPFGTTAGENEAQGDEVSFDVIYTLEQEGVD